jgi:hypothetical protein
MVKEYKVIWRDKNSLRGESYDRKLYTKSQAQRMYNEAKMFNEKNKIGANIKIVRERKNANNTQTGLFFRLPKIKNSFF